MPSSRAPVPDVRWAAIFVASCLLAMFLQACTTAPTPTAPQAAKPAEVPAAVASVASAPKEAPPAGNTDTMAWRGPAIEQAMRVASSFQSKSHVRVKSRMQREVAVAAIDIDRVDSAIACANLIGDWRRGEVLALAAQAKARAGDRRGAEACLALAAEVSADAKDWMLARLTTQIAVAYALLGDTDNARRLGARVSTDLTGEIEARLSDRLPLEELDRQSDAFDAAIATQSLDVARSGIDGHFAVWARVPEDPQRSARAEKSIRGAIPGLPEELQIEARIRLADRLARSGREADARQEVAEAVRLFRAHERLPDVNGPLARDVARAQMRHGDSTGARALVVEMVSAYERSPQAIVDIERADYLRPLAEALHAMGDDVEARRVWMLALEAGAVNVNARPRAEDLCQTSLSMIRSGVEPTPEMRSRMAAIEAGLKAPW